MLFFCCLLDEIHKSANVTLKESADHSNASCKHNDSAAGNEKMVIFKRGLDLEPIKAALMETHFSH